MSEQPGIITELIERLSELPGVGQKTATRYVYFLVSQPAEKLKRMGDVISTLAASVTTCAVCHRIAEKTPCSLCTDRTRDPRVLCVVAESQEITPIENTDKFRGRYHVLGGVINVLEGIGPDKLAIADLIQRVGRDAVSEIILALNPDMEGESTALHLAKLLKDKDVKVTRLARGLPMGSDLAYADEVTLASAIEGRQEVK